MNIGTILSSLVDGLLIGVVYGIAAMGLNLIWGVMRVINLAHGALISLGMFGVYLVFSSLGLNPYLALLLVALLGLLMGVIIYFIGIARVINAPYLSTLLATFSINMIIIGLGTAVFTTTPRDIGFSLGSIKIGPVILLTTRLLAAAVTLLVTAALYIFLYRTRTGKYIRAVSNNRSAAELMGIPSSRILALSFGIGTMLAAIAGGLIATFFSFTILSGDIYQQKSFVIGVLGGLGNPLGALVGGLVLGVLEGLLPLTMPNTWVPVIEFLLFILILLIKPSGLLGGRQ
ncbi:MAG TPA: branched-chain amino acid ABC transporter permease [Anaerolineales bacterium]|nr:branched-chain amino acid ABC transporter permease [Anaerolineales bacterium]